MDESMMSVVNRNNVVNWNSYPQDRRRLMNAEDNRALQQWKESIKPKRKRCAYCGGDPEKSRCVSCGAPQKGES